MKAEIISIGDELLIGQTVNTNAAYIGEHLTDAQVTVAKVTVIGDEEDIILDAFAMAMKNYDLVIVTGGLGPTHDDITRAAVCIFFQCGLVRNEDVLSDVQARFKKLNRPLSRINEEQSLVPEAAIAIRNTMGTAPGFWIERDGKIMAVMPGVPYEMKAMMTSFVLPRLTVLNSSAAHYTAKSTLLTTGIPESTLFEKLGSLDEILQGAKLAFLPNPEGVKMRITVCAATKEIAESRLDEIEQKIRAAAGRFIYGKNEDDLAEVVGRMLKERGLKLATAESCTGGNIAGRITNISGASEYFERGIISYSNAAKVELLNVDINTITKFGAVSEEAAKQMAVGIRLNSGADIGLGITGILGPTGATPDKPIGLVYIGISDANSVKAVKLQFGDDRVLNKKRATQAALALIRRMLLGISFDV